MPIFKQNTSRRIWLKILIFLIIILILSIYIFWDIITNGPISSFLNNRDTVIATISRMGIFAPLLFLLLQVLQIILAPIPGQVVGGVGGYLFGWWGIPITIIGSLIGYTAILLIAKRFGRPLLEKIFKKESIAKFDFALGDNASFILFLIFLLPGFPDDMVGYMAGLTNISFKKLLIIMLIGRLPTIIATNYIGMGLGEENLLPVIIASVIVVIFLGIIAWQREKIIHLLKNHNYPESHPPTTH